MKVQESPDSIASLTKSIKETATGRKFDTEVYNLREEGVRLLAKKNGWKFKWRNEFHLPNRECYYLTISGTQEIQGVISIENEDTHFNMHLLESAPHNIGKDKKYGGVMQSLVAFACWRSYQFGYEGEICFIPKTVLVSHYQKTLDAVSIGNGRMIIYEPTARKLVSLYFKNFTP